MVVRPIPVDEPTVLLGAVLPVAEALIGLGAPRDGIADLIGAPVPGTDLEARLPLSRLVRLETQAAGLTGLPAAGLAAGAICSGEGDGRGGLPGQIARHCDTFGEAVEAAVRAANAMSTGEVLGLEVSGAWAGFSFERRNPLHRTVFGAEVALSQFRALLGRIAPDAVAIRVEFAHARPGHVERYVEVFGNGVRFGRKTNRVLFARHLLDRPLRFADSYVAGVLADRAEALARTSAGPASARQAAGHHILSRLPHATPSASQVAAEMGMSESTLYRRLRAEGTSFRRVLDEIRRELAAQAGDRPMSREQLAYRLGYSSVRSLGHALMRWRV